MQPYQVYLATRWVLATADLSAMRLWTLSDDLGLTETTLRRRLASAGTSYAVLLREERFTRLQALLNTTTVPVYGNQVAKTVGVVGESSGYRIFHEYMGVSIRNYNLLRFGHCAPRQLPGLYIMNAST